MKATKCICGQVPVTAKEAVLGLYICQCVNSKCDKCNEPGGHRPRATRFEATKVWNYFAESFTAKPADLGPVIRSGPPWLR